MKISADEKARIIPRIQDYCSRELETELGGFEAEFLLDFFIKEVGDQVYNQALNDVIASLDLQLDAMKDNLYALEK
ncbi:DUF2164 domain-containing protein [Marinobacterium jannaschii]|uniref:DUF2164 domain-containing protein n=1 Tax=Marinobacterium jannaschii TaxID=64970 RepID=UPI000562F78B|nr:DUF2164 domain-containing protein [Marinobacterium jannaschii]